ncbi:MAG: ABC transporter substrate-binding protein [Candidatus Binatia bacterium]
MVWCKRGFHTIFLVFLFLSLTSFLSGSTLNAQSKELIEAAKKEGKVSIFGSLEKGTVRIIQDTFEKKYPGIKTFYWRGSTTAIMKKAMSEFRAKKVTWDVFFTSNDPMNIMRKQGMFTKYQTPVGKYFEKQYHHPFYSPSYRKVVVGFMYNTKFIKPEDAPKSYWDFVDPKWKGRITIPNPAGHTSTAKWLSSLHLVLGNMEKEAEYIDRLAKLKPQMLKSMLPTSKAIASGEVPLGLTYIKFVFIHGKAGAPLDYVRLPAYMGDSHYIALSAMAPRPNAGKLWIDHWYSQESMDIMAKSGEFVNRPGVYPPLKDADKIKYIEEVNRSKKEYKKLKKKYGKLFRK